MSVEVAMIQCHSKIGIESQPSGRRHNSAILVARVIFKHNVAARSRLSDF